MITLADSVATAQAARRWQVFSVKCGHLGAMEELAKTEPAQDYGSAYVRVVSRFRASKPVVEKG